MTFTNFEIVEPFAFGTQVANQYLCLLFGQPPALSADVVCECHLVEEKREGGIPRVSLHSQSSEISLVLVQLTAWIYFKLLGDYPVLFCQPFNLNVRVRLSFLWW